MVSQLALGLSAVLIFWLFRRDMRWRRLPSRALWIPGLWLAIVSSRSISFWLSMGREGGGESDNLQGNPINVVFNSALFLAAIVVLHRRGFSWAGFASNNKALVSIFAFFLCSVLWSPFPVPTLKRLIQEFGCVLIAPIVLTEKDPAASLRVIFVRVSYVLFPLSVVFIRYFPHIGRVMSKVSGTQMLSGVTDHKNALGQMTMVLSLVLIWDLMETRNHETSSRTKPEHWARLVSLAIGIYLLIISSSATALASFVFGVVMLFAGKRLARAESAKRLIIAGVLSIVCALALNNIFGIKDRILYALGRDPSLTGRTEIWQEIMEKNTSPIFGAGFRGFWETSEGQSVALTLGTNALLTAHNGYLELYLYGGLVALSLLGIFISSTGLNAVNNLIKGEPLGRLAVLFWPILLLNNVSESVFFLLGPLWFTMLIVTMGSPSENDHVERDNWLVWMANRARQRQRPVSSQSYGGTC